MRLVRLWLVLWRKISVATQLVMRRKLVMMRERFGDLMDMRSSLSIQSSSINSLGLSKENMLECKYVKCCANSLTSYFQNVIGAI